MPHNKTEHKSEKFMKNVYCLSEGWVHLQASISPNSSHRAWRMLARGEGGAALCGNLSVSGFNIKLKSPPTIMVELERNGAKSRKILVRKVVGWAGSSLQCFDLP